MYKTHLIMVYPETYTTSGLQGSTSHGIYRNIYILDIKKRYKNVVEPLQYIRCIYL